MPGESWDDFEAGQYVGIAYGLPGGAYHGKIGRITNLEEHPVAKDGIRAWIEGVGSGFPSGGWSKPHQLFTAEETENILYHCSNCGKPGHNRRTCPKGTEVYIDKTIQVGDVIKIAGAKSAANAKKPQFNKYFGIEFKVKQVTPTTVRTEGADINGKQIGSSSTLHFDRNLFLFSPGGQDVEEDVKKIDIWDLAEMVIPVARLVLLFGPPGTGKTTAANFVKKADGSLPEVYNITLTEETPAAELRGHFIPKGTEFIWMDGPAMMAFRHGCRLVLNEIDKASGDALTFCHALLDDPGIARITLPTSETIMPHEGFHVIATMNGHPDDLPEALKDRFAIRLNIDKLHPDAVLSLPADLHQVAKKGVSRDAERSVSVRGWKAFAQLREMVGEREAALAVFGERAETVLNTIKIARVGGAKKVSK